MQRVVQTDSLVLTLLFNAMLSGTVQDCTGLSRTVQSCPGLFRTVQGCPGLSRAVQDCRCKAVERRQLRLYK